ncbi:MAG TPA: 2-amino-4-hydroxy-6-hydroxymethyldihydropteridine diphosphokinase [Gammaproteobacteria bacterium]|nr:2-amino-4-hydroxy-6-hydroxymethyldihydropteridine diphosphokinase [Gammaproteobacteria bacterium]
MTAAWIGLGSNLGDSRAEIEAAFAELDSLPHTSLRSRSRLYRTRPVGPVAQPDFVNAAAALETALAPEELLDALLAVEARHGRERREHWGPRTLDLDILLYDETQIATARLSVPHPRLAERAFALCPLADIAPQAEVPGAGSVAVLLARLDTSGVTPLAPA